MPKRLVAYLYLVITLLVLTACTTENTNQATVDKEKVLTKNVQIDQENSPEETVDIKDINMELDEKLDTSKAVKQLDKPLSNMVVHYIDVGQADATLLQFGDTNGDYTMLIDTGNWGTTDLVQYLQSENITSIDIIAITHPHADHIGQLDKIIETFDIDEVWMNGEISNSDIFNRSLAAIENNGVGYYEPVVGELFDIGPLEVEILHPSSLSGGTNDNSLAMRMEYGAVSFLFTGDGETKAELEMVQLGANLKADFLHVGHHGSKTSTTEAFFNLVNPEVAIYSAGVDNQYNHPDQEVVDRIESNDTLLYGTDIHGTIRVETDGVTYTIQTRKHGTLPEEPEATEEVKEAVAVTESHCVNINEDDESVIQHIIHIGPDRAKMLIDARPYLTLDDLSKINGIGPGRIEDIKAQGVACTGG